MPKLCSSSIKKVFDEFTPHILDENYVPKTPLETLYCRLTATYLLTSGDNQNVIDMAEQIIKRTSTDPDDFARLLALSNSITAWHEIEIVDTDNEHFCEYQIQVHTDKGHKLIHCHAKYTLENNLCKFVDQDAVSLVSQLNNEYMLKVYQTRNAIQVRVLKAKKEVGLAKLVTDHVDVFCITHLEMLDEDVNSPISGQENLADTFIKFLIKFPTMVRKSEFRFITAIPANLKPSADKYHFSDQSHDKDQNEIFLGQNIQLPSVKSNEARNDLVFTSTIEKELLPTLCLLLQKNAYWKDKLTLDWLKLLVDNSSCYFVFKDNKLIGFARVLTDNTTFASLWDVFVDESCRKQGIAKALMHHIFSDEKLRSLKTWVIFPTDIGKELYKQFNFVSAADVPNRTLLHKIRLDDTIPANMSEMIAIVHDKGLPHALNAEQSQAFLFRNKRAVLSQFWQSVPPVTTFDTKNDYPLTTSIVTTLVPR